VTVRRFAPSPALCRVLQVFLQFSQSNLRAVLEGLLHPIQKNNPSTWGRGRSEWKALPSETSEPSLRVKQRLYWGDAGALERRLFSADHCDPLNLDQKAGHGQPTDGDQRTSGEAFLEDVLADLGELVAKSRIRDEHRHGHQILQT
jgi:hypothetical protein